MWEKISDIQIANEKDKLVVFVGAGVSKNSGIPTWSELIDSIAAKISHDKCAECSSKQGCAIQDTCKKKNEYSSDEFLKIPQYYYDSLADDKSDYNNLIQEKIDINASSNDINKAIIELTPKHIITTNYDHLIEETPDIYTKLYMPIKNDSDLLKHSAEHYIIKMHGDLTDIENIVLKEDDYLQYSQNHPLIETFIKSLLVDHVFLFVGYSLNDYNLKIIMGWLDHLINIHGIKTTVKNYLIISKENVPPYEITSLESKKIYPINTQNLLESVKKQFSSNKLSHRIGKETYAAIKHIGDTDYLYHYKELSEVLAVKFSSFDSFNYIPHSDLLSLHKLGIAREKIGMDLYITEDSGDGKKIDEKKEILKAIGNPLVGDYFHKAMIDTLVYLEEGKGFVKYNIASTSSEPSVDDELFQLYLDNDYSTIDSKLKSLEDLNLVAFYIHVINPPLSDEKEQIETLLTQEYKTVDIQSYFKILQIIFNKISNSMIQRDSPKNNNWDDLYQAIEMIPPNMRKAYNFMCALCNPDGKIEGNIFKMFEFLEKTENEYMNSKNSIIFGGTNYSKFPQIQSYVYEYYFFFKQNYLMMDWFNNANNYFENYIKAILCTYYPQSPSEGVFARASQTLERYTCNEVDLDIIVKYVNTKDLRKFLHYYAVDTVDVMDSIDIALKYNNLLDLCTHEPVAYNTPLENFSVIIGKLEISDEVISGILNRYISVIQNVIETKPLILHYILPSLFEIIESTYSDEIPEFINLTEVILQDNVFDFLSQQSYPSSNKFPSILKLLSKKDSPLIARRVTDIFNAMSETDNSSKVFLIRYFLPSKLKSQYIDWLGKNLDKIPNSQTIYLLSGKYINYQHSFFDNILGEIENILQERKKTGAIGFPDMVENYINDAIIFWKWGHITDEEFAKLKKYKEQYAYLEMIFNPKEFDYSKFNLDVVTWQNLARNGKVRADILLYGKDIIKRNLERKISDNIATEEERRFFYKHLEDD